MNARIWASLDDYLHPSQGGSWLGRNMANYYFLSALFRYGTFDEYHFFMANGAHRQLFLKAHDTLISSLGLADKVKVFERLELPSQLSNTDYTVFHQSDHINYFNALCRLRERFGNGFPVTAFIHSISYQEYMPRYLEMALAGPGPHDALICSSKCGKKALQNVFSRFGDVVERAGMPMQMPVVPLGIDEQKGAPSKTVARRRLGIHDDEVIALGFGRFSELDKMDLFPLLQAFRDAVPDGVPHRLVLAGSVHSPSYLEMVRVWVDALKLSDLVRIFTEPNDDQKQDLFAAADFFVSLADNPQETFGLTVLEAMHAGLPLLVSDFDGYRELVTDDVGFRVPTLWHAMPELDLLQPVLDERTFHLLAAQSVSVNVSYVKDALQVLFGDAALRARMGMAARLRFSACYAHETVIRKLEALWFGLKNGFVKRPESRIDPLSLNTFDSFAHYTTFALEEDALLVTSAFGQKILSKGMFYPLLPNMTKIVDVAVAVDILTRAAAPVSTKKLMEPSSIPAWQFRYIVLWLLKHGLLALANSAE